jgi:hypothetical protein
VVVVVAIINLRYQEVATVVVVAIVVLVKMDLTIAILIELEVIIILEQLQHLLDSNHLPMVIIDWQQFTLITTHLHLQILNQISN